MRTAGPAFGAIWAVWLLLAAPAAAEPDDDPDDSEDEEDDDAEEDSGPAKRRRPTVGSGDSQGPPASTSTRRSTPSLGGGDFSGIRVNLRWKHPVGPVHPWVGAGGGVAVRPGTQASIDGWLLGGVTTFFGLRVGAGAGFGGPMKGEALGSGRSALRIDVLGAVSLTHPVDIAPVVELRGGASVRELREDGELVDTAVNGVLGALFGVSFPAGKNLRIAPFVRADFDLSPSVFADGTELHLFGFQGGFSGSFLPFGRARRALPPTEVDDDPTRGGGGTDDPLRRLPRSR